MKDIIAWFRDSEGSRKLTKLTQLLGIQTGNK